MSPTLKHVEQVSDLLNANVGWLITGKGKPPRENKKNLTATGIRQRSLVRRAVRLIRTGKMGH